MRARRGEVHTYGTLNIINRRTVAGISICALVDLEDIPVDNTNSSWKHKSKVHGRKSKEYRNLAIMR